MLTSFWETAGAANADKSAPVQTHTHTHTITVRDATTTTRCFYGNNLYVYKRARACVQATTHAYWKWNVIKLLNDVSVLLARSFALLIFFWNFNFNTSYGSGGGAAAGVCAFDTTTTHTSNTGGTFTLNSARVCVWAFETYIILLWIKTNN